VQAGTPLMTVENQPSQGRLTKFPLAISTIWSEKRCGPCRKAYHTQFAAVLLGNVTNHEVTSRITCGGAML